MVPPEWQDQRAKITTSLLLRRGRVRAVGAETWIDHRCLFHDDAVASASWQEQTGVYYCRTEDRTFAVPAVLEMLFLAPASGAAAPSVLPRDSTPTPPKAPRDKRLARVFEYRFPDGRLSHRKYRVGDGGGKTIWQEGPDGELALPEQTYPIYGDFGAHKGQSVLVVEGEKKVDFVNDLAEPDLVVITCGSSADHRHNAAFLAARIRDLEPLQVLLWPDHDEAGQRAMEAVESELASVSVPFVRLDPVALGVPPKGDVVDWVIAGGQLADVVRKAQAPKSNGSLDELIGRLVVTHDGHVMFPQTRNLVKINDANARAIWYHQLHAMPKDAQSKELSARLEVKAHLMPTRVQPRQHNSRDQTWWRPRSSGPAYQITAAGVRIAEDPPEIVLMPPADELDYPVDVDLDGGRSDLVELCKHFHLSETEITMCEAWLVCALAGLQTPIMFMRAPAGTGKTTLARLLLAIVEPLCPEIDASKRQNQDMREFIHILRSSQAMLLDNVARLDSTLEDQLAKMVTGYTTALRPLYFDGVVTMRIRRALIITTTSYDVYKGDLAQRMIVTSPTIDSALGWLPDSLAQDFFVPFVPRIRGWIFHRVAEFYARREGVRKQREHMRIADLGLVLTALGYDTAALARHESTLKSSVIAIDDPWLECLVAIWKEHDVDMFWLSTTDLLAAMRDFGLKDLPPERSPKLARYLGEKNPILRDHGFQIERHNTEKQRGWGFSVYQPELSSVPESSTPVNINE